MCALFGWLDYKGIVPYKVLKKLTQVLANAAEERGTDVAGISYIKEGKVTIFKRPKPAHKIKFNAPDGTKVVMGHTRLTTQGNQKHNFNNHPFRGRADREFAFAHNGVLYNDDELHIETGKLQGWNFLSANNVVWEHREKYPEALHQIVPKSILEREKPKNRFKSDDLKRKAEEKFNAFFGKNTRLKLMYLLRIASYNSTFAHKFKTDFDQILVIGPSETVTPNLLTAMLKNDTFSSSDVLTLGGKTKSIDEQISQRNDGVLLVVDETKADEPNRRKGNIELLESSIASKSKDNQFLTVVISKYAAAQIRSDLCCYLSIGDFNSSLEQHYIKHFLEWNDSRFLSEIEGNFKEYIELYRLKFTEVSLTISSNIPQNRRQTYIALATVARTYDEFFDYFFGEKVERFITEWLSDYTEHGACIDEEILRDFGQCLNKEISSGKFHYIKRKNIW